jgi:Beta/Gamma crystallin
MTKINKQSISLYNVKAVEDIDHESAAAISGGAVTVTDVTLYSESNKQGFRFPSNKKIEDLTEFGFNDATGSITVSNDKTWRFYEDANFGGEFIDVEPGQSVNAGDFGKKISSFEAI